MTFEDVKRIRQNPTAEDVDNQEFHKMIDLAIEKQIPKKPEIYDDDCRADCPICGRTFENNVNEWGCKHCPDCSQALDWGDTE